MKEIMKLLKVLDTVGDRAQTTGFHRIELFSDNSGEIFGLASESMGEFESKSELKKRLTELIIQLLVEKAKP